MTTRRRLAIAAVLWLTGTLSLWALHPRIGIRDGDAVAYVTGALSLHAGHGYVDLQGGPLNHWPPGYSWLLSWFSSPIAVAQQLNYMAFGAAAAALFWNASIAGWTTPAALAMTVAISLGLFRGLATNVAPDILTYALFLGVLPLYRQPGRAWWVPYVVWSGLIIFKLIAVILVPAALIAAWWSKEEFWPRRAGAVVLGWGSVLTAIVAFNYMSMGHLFPSSYAPATLTSFLTAWKLVLLGIPRQGLAFWYGSIRGTIVLAGFGVVVALGAVCYLSLSAIRRSQRVLAFGAAILALSFLLQLVREYSGGWRLTAYGMFALVLALRTRPSFNRVWVAYGIASVALAIANATTVNAAGGNDVRYELIARAARQDAHPGLETNSYHVLDVHEGIATVPVTSFRDVKGREFLWVQLPSFDGTATVVWPIDIPSSGWCEAGRYSGATLLRRCGAAG